MVVALLEEVLELRKEYHEIPILCLGVVGSRDIKMAVDWA